MRGLLESLSHKVILEQGLGKARGCQAEQHGRVLVGLWRNIGKSLWLEQSEGRECFGESEE